MNKVTNFTLPNGETVQVQDPHALTLDENTSVTGTFDFGAITAVGNYNVPTNAEGAPETVSVTTGTLKVLYDNNKPVQIYIHRITNKIFVRSMLDNGSWGSWVDITMSNELASSISHNNSLITSETNNRTTADTRLSTLISDETTNRKSADSSLQTKITANTTEITNETTQRKSADAALQASIDNVETNVTALQSLKALSGVPSSVSLYSGTPITAQDTQVTIDCISPVSGREGYYYGMLYAQGTITISSMNAKTEYTVRGSTQFTLNGITYEFETRAPSVMVNVYGYTNLMKLVYTAGQLLLYPSAQLTGYTIQTNLVVPIVYHAV